MSETTAANPTTTIHDIPLTWLLSDLNINRANLSFGTNFRPTQVAKSGFISRIKGTKQYIDIDLSCLIFDHNCTLIDQVWFKQLRDKSQAIRHNGDSLNGKDRGSIPELDHNIDLEKIELHLTKLNPDAHHLALIVTSYYGQPLPALSHGSIKLTDDENNVIDLQDLTILPETCNALWYAGLSRELGEWRVTMHKLALQHHSIPKIAEEIRNELLRSFVPN
ncbi:TerD family protein [Psychrobacter sp. I-STPA10]|uniref:TerD family protein n=1 Tax=Psychrobacter sp. I-STPA10 TaxID=2585769 RepID=UPI001E2CE892|nr:TerD family protein [Psychrobacter sp. I-STPA10]